MEHFHGILKDFAQTPSFLVSNSYHSKTTFTPSHSHEFGCLHFTHAGVYQEEIEHRKFAVGKGKILYKPPEIDHCNAFRLMGASTCRIELHLALLHDVVLPPQPLLIDSPVLANLFRRIHVELCRNDDLSKMAIEGLSWELLCEFCRESTRLNVAKPTTMTLRAEEIIRDRFPNLPKIAMLAEELGIHRSQLARMFQATYGMTISDFIRQLRIEKAMELLRANKKSIAEIALECGFNDQSHFTRNFRSVTSTTPAKWRR